MSFVVAIVGRPNVGKSTLFNRLVGHKTALVAATPGVTRDRREGEGRIADLRFTVIDTAGFEEAAGETLEARMQAQTERAVDAADVALLLIDAREGVTPLDRHFATWLRKRSTPVVLVANKCEGRGYEAGVLEGYALGLGDPVAVSAEHGEGLADLYAALAARRPGAPEEGAGAVEPIEEARGPLCLAIVGRPNAGKSTLANRLLGEERLLTGPEPGITRDAIAIDWTYEGRALRLVDTAGLRRRARVVEALERLSAADTLRAIRFAHVVVVVVDATQVKDIGPALDRQDLAIVDLAAEEGRAPVIAVNKWDVVEDRERLLRRIRDSLEDSLPQVRGVALVPVSALGGRHLDRLMDAVLAADERWNARFATGPLNRWLTEVIGAHPPPLDRGRPVKLRYITQIKSRPPTFALFVNRPQALPESYLRYLINGLRRSFGLPGVPIRLVTRRGKNPYVAQ